MTVVKTTPETVHWGYFDSKLKPVATIRSGGTVTIECVSGGPDILPGPPFTVLPEHREIHAKCAPHIGRHILTGPVFVEGARRGDVLQIDVVDIKIRVDWGWNVQRPNMGTLPEDFPSYRLTHIPIDHAAGVCLMPWGTRIPLKPFFGIMGVAPPPEWGQCSSVEPRAFGGNIDNKELGVGATLYLPVFTDGALFSAGDGHGVQGDGEVNLTALETCLAGTFRLTVRRDMKMATPRAETPTHWITHAFDPDLDVCAREALRDMIRFIRGKTGISAEDAYMLCSLAADLHVTQTVDGNKGIHCMIRKELVGG
ncbi:MAG: acetamidase/formamidase family protein [Rhodospirillales bacterium]|nr:MAG: acetamidase/formamidase family protein [Rhodospirillales bacterium]